LHGRAHGIGRKAGVTEEEMRALQAEQDGGFSAPERAAIRYARELTRTADGAQTRDALNEHYNDEQIVEITLIAAMANFTNRLQQRPGPAARAVRPMAILSGINPVLESLKAGRPLDRILIAKGAAGARLQEIIDLARRASVSVRFEERGGLDRLAGTPAHQGVVAMGRRSATPNWTTWRRPRSCWWCWMAWKIRTIWAPSCARRTPPARAASSFRSGARWDLPTWWPRPPPGALEYLPVVRATNINRTLERLKELGYWIYGLDERGTEDYDAIEYNAPTAWFSAARARACTSRCASIATCWCAFPWKATFRR
jgi:23S rRNA (guanosine2251-2'-O)-methyltransferase